MATDTYYRSNGKTYCVRKYSDASYKVWDPRNNVIGEVKSLAAAFDSDAAAKLDLAMQVAKNRLQGGQ